MSVSHNIFSFIAGEVSPKFYNRADLSKYPLGLSEAINFNIDFEGGASNRPGSGFLGGITEALGAVRMFRFEATGNDVVVILIRNKMLLMQNGQFFLDTAQTISGITAGTQTTVEVTGHGLANEDLVVLETVSNPTPQELADRVFQVAVVDANNFRLEWPGGGDVDSSNWDAPVPASFSLRKVTTLITQWGDLRIPDVRMTQDVNEAYFTHVATDPQLLAYDASTQTFTLSRLNPESINVGPPGVNGTPSAAGNSGFAFGVTAVNAQGEESVVSRPTFELGSVNYSVTEGSYTISWDRRVGSSFYNVYRTLIMPNTEITAAQELGFIGRAFGPVFVDNNIIPDFTKSPPNYNTPFVGGAVEAIGITAQGSGYARTVRVDLIDATGEGFVGYGVVNQAGNILDVQVVSPGRNYTAPTVSLSVTGGGTGAVLVAATPTPLTGNYPSVSARFQQRIVYAGTENQPATVWGTKPGTAYNFDFSPVPAADDSYTFTLDSPSNNPIRHMIALRQGLLIFTNYGVFQLRAATGSGVTATNALTEPQAYKAVSAVEPLAIDLNVLFTQQEGSAVYSMNYTYYTESFQLQDITVLASHLFTRDRQVIRMTYKEEPEKFIYCVRSDGRRLVCTYEPEQEVIAWTQDETRGLYRDSLVIQEDNRFTLYQVVDRYINGAWRRYVERQYVRDTSDVEDLRFVDSGLILDTERPDVELTFSAATGTGVTATADSSFWTSGHVGDIIYAAGGKAEITAVVSGTEATVTWLRDATSTIPQEPADIVLPVASGDWELVTPVTTLRNLEHLEGEDVAVLADGNVVENQTVTNGTITLQQAASRIIVGLPYTCSLTGLPPTAQRIILQDKRKTFLAAAVNTLETRGLSMGAKGSELFEIPNRTYEDWGEPINTYTGTRYSIVQDGWNIDTQMRFEQRYPLPASVLGFASLIEIGDDR